MPLLARVSVVAAGAAAALAGACAGEPETPAGDAPLVVEPQFLDLGSVPFGERREGRWTLTNAGSEPLHVTRIGPFSCQCVRAELRDPDRPGWARRLDGGPLGLTLAPGRSWSVSFVLDTSRFRRPVSRKVGRFPVLLRDHAPVLLEWGADVWTPFQVEPWAIQLGEVGVRERASGWVLVAAHDEARFGLAVDREEHGWRLRSERVSPDGAERDTYRITVTAPPELPEGPFQERFRVHTDLAGAPPVRFAVQGVAVPDLSWSPQRLLLDPARGRAQARLVFTQRAPGAELAPPRVLEAPEGVVAEAAGASAVHARPGAPAQQSLTVRWTRDAPAEPVSGRLLIATGDEDTPRAEIPFTVLPARPERE